MVEKRNVHILTLVILALCHCYFEVFKLAKV